MKNKVLIKLVFPELDEVFDVFIPINEVVWKIKKMLLKSISDLTNVPIDLKLEYVLLNEKNGRIYRNNEVVINTDIRNATELVMFSNKNN